MFIISKIFTLTSLFILSTFTVSLTTKAAQYIQFNEENIQQVKTSLHNNNAHEITNRAYDFLLQNADLALTMTPPTVIDKKFNPPSNNKHDYLSISRYWWPDPKSSNGLPWIRKDGITNPDTQTDDVDRRRLGKVTNAIRNLSLAYYFSNNEKYAQKSVQLISTWFLDEKTRMNPHFQYSQSVPGNPKGRRSGILDGRLIPERVLDSLTLLSKSPHWTTQKNKQMNHWLNDYLTWLTTSKLGKSGAKQTNNHGSWYRFQVASLAWYLGQDKLLSQAINATKNSFNYQFTAEGAQEHELQRTRGFFYSAFNLRALSRIATIADKVDLSLWEYESDKGHTLKNGIDYLMPVTRGEQWPHSSKKLDLSHLLPLLIEIMKYQPEAQYKTALTNILDNLSKNTKLEGNQKLSLFEVALFNPAFLQK